MMFTRNEKKLLEQATRSLPEKFRIFLIECLKDEAGKSQWFHENLFYTLNNGLTFKMSKNMESVARYDVGDKSVFFDRIDFDKNVPIEIMAEAIKLLVRHYITHAYNFLLKDNFSMMVAKSLESFKHKANVLHNALACISNTNSIDLTVLNSLTPYMRHDDNITGSVTFANMSSLTEKWYPFSIATLGSFIVLDDQYKLDHYALKFYPFGYSYLDIRTLDPVIVYELFQNSTAKRQLTADPNALSQHFHKYLDPAKWQFWNSLTRRQRKTLNTLYSIHPRILDNVVQDDICYPPFKECVINEELDCVVDFKTCQWEQEDKDIVIKSVLNIHACMQERGEFESIEISSLDNLCHLSPAKPPISMPAAVDHFKLVFSRETIMIPPVMALSNAHAASLLYGLCYSAGMGISFSFFNELSQAYIDKQRYRNKEMLNLLTNAGYLYIVGYLQYWMTAEDEASISTQIVLPVVLGIVKQGIETLSKNLKLSRTTQWIKQVGNAAVGLTLLGSNYTPLTVMSNIVGNFMGSSVAKSITKALGWPSSGSFFTSNTMNYLVKKYKLPNNAQSSLEQGLRKAVVNHQVDDLQEFIKLTRNVNAQDTNPKVRRTALHWAGAKGHQDCYELLLKSGADASIKDAEGNTALDCFKIASQHQISKLN